MLTTLVSALLATVGGTVALTLMTVQEWSVQETALALMVLIRSHVFAIMVLREKTALVGMHVCEQQTSRYLKVKDHDSIFKYYVGSP